MSMRGTDGGVNVLVVLTSHSVFDLRMNLVLRVLRVKLRGKRVGRFGSTHGPFSAFPRPIFNYYQYLFCSIFFYTIYALFHHSNLNVLLPRIAVESQSGKTDEKNGVVFAKIANLSAKALATFAKLQNLSTFG